MSILLPDIIIEPGGEYDFAITDSTTIQAHVAGSWNGDASNQNILNSEDGATQATIIIPQDINLRYATVSNIAVSNPYKIYCDGTCVDGGNNNANVVFGWLKVSAVFVLISGVWRNVIAESVLPSTVWKTVSNIYLKK